MKKWLFVVLLAVCWCPAMGQGPSDKDARIDAIFVKIRQVDLLYNILPALLTKDQINRLLPALEKARVSVRQQKDLEYDQYIKIEPELDRRIGDAVQRNVLPPKTSNEEWNNLIAKLQIVRSMIVQKEIAIVRGAMDDTLSKTQLKVMANMVDPRVFDAKAKPDEMSQDDKLTIYIREILLDPLTYDLLVKMAKPS